MRAVPTTVEIVPTEGAALPPIARAAIVLTFFNSWVLFEETVIDRYGLWQYLPYYRYGKLCAWDIGALALIVWLVWRKLRRTAPGTPGAPGQPGLG